MVKFLGLLFVVQGHHGSFIGIGLRLISLERDLYFLRQVEHASLESLSWVICLLFVFNILIQHRSWERIFYSIFLLRELGLLVEIEYRSGQSILLYDRLALLFLQVEVHHGSLGGRLRCFLLRWESWLFIQIENTTAQLNASRLSYLSLVGLLF